MTRTEKFESLRSHAWLARVFKKLSKNDIKICREFLWQNQELDKNDFEIKVNRMFLDKERPKNWTIILEVLANANVS